MDTDKKPLAGTNSESSLSESWNVIETQEVHVSEGSDGESIEVIDEDAQNTDSNTPLIKDAGSNTECSVTSRSDEEDQHLGNCKVIQADEGNCDSTDVRLSETETSGGICLFNTCGLLVLFVAILCTGASISVFLLKVEQLALGTFSYFSSKPIENNEKEYQELLNQIKMYKEESKDLKNLITGLNSAVLSLKKELDSQKNTAKNGIANDELNFPPRTKKEDTLFQQILNVHMDNYPQGNTSNQEKEKEMPYENSFKAIKEILLNFSSEYKREDEMEIIKIFSRIPKHLSVLNNFDSSNQNINKFIEVWEAKLLRANEKLIADIKQMQLKMARHIIKNLKTTQKNFFEKLCELKDMKKPQCYDTFIKPYQSFDSSVPPKELKNQPSAKGDFCSNAQKNKNKHCTEQMKRNFDFNDSSETKKEEKIEVKEKDHTEGRLIKSGDIKSENIDNSHVKTMYIENLNEKNVESNSVPGNSFESAPLVRNPHGKNINKYTAQPNSGKNKDKNINKEKGMNSDLIHEGPNKSAINSFSSFSEANNGQNERSQGEVQEGTKRYEEILERRGEGSWFLRMGNHRSKIRNSKVRGDWLFERARYRRRRNLHCHQPWLSKIPGNFDKFSPDFLKSQGFI